MTFLDDLVAGDERIAEFVRDATAVRVQNVADYYYTGTAQEHWWPKDFPNCAPPWQRYFLVWKLPRFSNKEGKLIEFPADMRHDTVTVVHAIELRERPLPELMKPEDEGQTISVRWVLPMMHYIRPAALSGHNFITIFQVMLVAPDGAMMGAEQLDAYNSKLLDSLYKAYRFPMTFKPYSDTIDSIVRFVRDGIMIDPDEVPDWVMEGVRPGITNMYKVLALTNSFVHCSNQVKVLSEPVPKALLKKRERRGERQRAPVTVWRTLEIEPIRRILNEIQRTRSVNLQTALHLARGHFKKYGPKFGTAKLFGKYEGSWFWHPQLRGSKGAGEVHKDYDINPNPKKENE